MLTRIIIYSLISIFIILFLLYFLRRKPVTESATTSTNLVNNAYANNAYITNIDAKLDDLTNKVKTVQDSYQNINTILQFKPVEKIDDSTADPEIYITGEPPNQFIQLKLPKGIKGPRGCVGPIGSIGSPGAQGNLGNQGASGLKVIPSVVSNKPLPSIE